MYPSQAERKRKDAARFTGKRTRRALVYVSVASDERVRYQAPEVRLHLRVLSPKDKMLDHSLTLAIRADHNARAAWPDFLAQLERYYDVDSKARAEARRLLLSIYWRARVGPKHWTDDTPTNVQAWAHEQITAHHTAHGWRGEVVAARCVLVDGRRTKSRRRFMRMSKQTYCPNYCHFALRCPIDGRAYLLGYNHRGPDQ